jgi:glutamate transport system permease protein
MTNLMIAVRLTTALASQVPMNPPELTGIVKYINTRTTAGITPFCISALCYAGSAFVIGLVGNWIDKKARILR